MSLQRPVAAPSSQPFAGNYSGEPQGWFVNAKDGRPLKACRAAVSGWLYHVDFHQGLDQYGALGTPLLAMESGTVYSVDPTIGYIRVKIQGHSNVIFSFTHCDTFKVGVGAKVARGEVIATMGKKGNATGVHVHTQIEIYENGRWIQYDPCRFMPANSVKLGSGYAYPSLGYAAGAMLHGGDLIYDDRIYPIRAITINGGVNVRTLPDVTSAAIVQTTAAAAATQLNEIPGGAYTIAGVAGTLWAKVKLASGQIGYVAKPLIKVG